MYGLFELAKLITFVKDEENIAENIRVVKYAWKEVGEKSFLSLFFSNGTLLLWYQCSGSAPIVKQVPWVPGEIIASMCHDPSGAWLLLVTTHNKLCIIPALTLLDRKAIVDQLWRIDDMTRITLKHSKIGVPTTCLCWWNTSEGGSIAILGTKVGLIIFVDLQRGRVCKEVDISEHITNLELVYSDQMTFTYVLISTKSNSQWKIMLEEKVEYQWPIAMEEPTAAQTFDTEDKFIVLSILQLTEEQNSSGQFLPARVHQFSTSVLLSAQYAKGRHFIAAHDLRTSLYQVYESNMTRSALYEYRLPDTAEDVVYTDRLTFVTSCESDPTEGVSRLVVMANQMLEAAGEQEFNKQAQVQAFELEPSEKILGVFHKSFPYSWHNKREQRIMEESSLHIATHTVLDGCMLLTNRGLYQCRPRVSPERLFLESALSVSIDYERLECLGIMLALNMSALYQQAAEVQLAKSQCTHATKLLTLAKISATDRVKLFIQYGRLAEVSSYIVHLLQQAAASGGGSSDLYDAERTRLANLAVQSLLQQLLEKNGDREVEENLREFLLSNKDYNERDMLHLLITYGQHAMAIDVAQIRHLLAETIELFNSIRVCPPLELTRGLLGSEHHTAKLHTEAHGLLLQSLSSDIIAQLLRSKPQVAVDYLSFLDSQLPLLADDDIKQVAAIFDVTATRMQEYIRAVHAQQRSRRRLSNSSISSLSDSFYGRTFRSAASSSNTSPVSISELMHFFCKVLVIHNARRTPTPTEDFLFLAEAADDDDDDGKEESKQEVSEAQNQQVLCHRPCRIACGHQHSAVIQNGRLFTFGSNKHDRLGLGESFENDVYSSPNEVSFDESLEVLSVSVGANHTVVITTQGVYSWGSNTYGQLGIGNTTASDVPIKVQFFDNITVVKIVVGQYHCVGLSEKAQAYSWGWGVHGQLGVSSIEDQHTPTLVSTLEGHTVVDVAAGHAHTVFATKEGKLFICGCNSFGQLGDTGATNKAVIPVEIMNTIPGKVKLLDAKYFHTLALTSDGRLFSWGASPQMLRQKMIKARRAAASAGVQRGGFHRSQHQLRMQQDRHLKPMRVTTNVIETDITQICCGCNFNALLTTDGEVYTYGNNYHGQLGHGTRQDGMMPSLVVKINDVEVRELGVGMDYCIARDSRGGFWGWGRFDNGQLTLRPPPDFYKNMKRKADDKHIGILQPVELSSIPTALPEHRKKDSSPWWFEEHVEHADLDLDKISSDEQDKYSVEWLWRLIQHLRNYCSVESVHQLAVLHGEWRLAARLACMLKLNTQAFSHCLRILENQPEKEGKEYVSDCLAYFIRWNERSCKSEKPGENPSTPHEEMTKYVLLFWMKQQWSQQSLEEVLSKYLPQLAVTLFLLITRQSAPDNNYPAFTNKFHAAMSLTLLQQLDLDPSMEAQLGQGQHIIEEILSKSTTKSPDTLVSAQKLWQIIFQNLKKDRESESVSTDRKMEADVSGTVGNQDNRDRNGKAAILFTCGHHYTQDRFLDKISYMENERAGSLNTAAVLSGYYDRNKMAALACPVCVLAAIEVMN